jgi:hypothetical protein
MEIMMMHRDIEDMEDGDDDGDMYDDSGSDEDEVNIGDVVIIQDLQDSDDDVDYVPQYSDNDVDSVPQDNVCIGVEAAWTPTYTIALAGTFHDSRKKSSVWDFFGHFFFPVMHDMSKTEKVCHKEFLISNQLLTILAVLPFTVQRDSDLA